MQQKLPTISFRTSTNFNISLGHEETYTSYQRLLNTPNLAYISVTQLVRV